MGHSVKMKMNPFHYTFFSALIILCFVTGCKDKLVGIDIPRTGSVAGKITITVMTGDTYPLSGVTVYLINADFKVDTVNYEGNKAAIIDSAVTDTSGKYSFDNVKEGNYNVVPLPGKFNYKFYLTSDSDPYSVSINDEKQQYSVNFATQDFAMADEGSLTLRFVSKNLSSLDSLDALHINIDRTQWWTFIPNNIFFNCFQSYAYNFNQPIDFCPQYGWTCLVYTLSNNFVFSFAVDDYQGNRTYIYNSKTFSCSIDFGLSNCPELAVFEIDWSAGTVTRTQ